MKPKLVPELDVTDLDASLGFYVQTCGFEVVYERSEERFAYLEREGANLMLEQADGPGRRFHTAPMERPYGRGVNLQIEATDVDALHTRIVDAGHRPLVPIENQWYRRGEGSVGNRQFVVKDPDGYLLRFFEHLGARTDP